VAQGSATGGSTREVGRLDLLDNLDWSQSTRLPSYINQPLWCQLSATILGWSLNTRELNVNKTEEWNGKSFAVLKRHLFGFFFFAL
jgi:hypothetical protein